MWRWKCERARARYSPFALCFSPEVRSRYSGEKRTAKREERSLLSFRYSRGGSHYGGKGSERTGSGFASRSGHRAGDDEVHRRDHRLWQRRRVGRGIQCRRRDQGRGLCPSSAGALWSVPGRRAGKKRAVAQPAPGARAMKHVVIVGGGFAGLACARRLAKHPDVRVTLIDKNNYHQFQPLLYQVAGSFLSPSNIAFNLREVLSGHPNADVKLGEVVSADPATHTVHTAEGQTYHGDILVLAAGSQANFFGTPGAEQYSYPLYSLRDAEKLRSRILAMLESADRDPSLADKGALHFVIVGGGATGTEMAGAFGDALRHLPSRNLFHLDVSKGKIVLVDGGHALLNGFTSMSQAYAARSLEDREVELRLETRVKEVHPGHVVLSDGSHIDTHTVIWAGGLKASALAESLGIKTGHGGRIDVKPDLTVPGVDGVYALGDFANIADKHGQ